MLGSKVLNVDERPKKVAFVARTIGLEYDDRIRKECLALRRQGVEVHIFVNFYDNEAKSGVTSYGTQYESFKLKTREKFASSKYLFLKALEFYLQVKPKLSKYDTIWAHEEYAFMFPLLSGKGRCIWDLHEIPFRFESKKLRPIFRYIEKKSKKIIHANQERIDYLVDKHLIQQREKHVYINNFPDDSFLETEVIDAKVSKFLEWKGASEHVYLQGLSVKGRYPKNSVESALSIPNIKVVVVGGYEESAMEYLNQKYGEKLTERVFFAGMIEQLSIPMYLKGALFSIVLYDDRKANNKYCEPNRLFQSVAMKIPVVVGANPPMKNLVERLGVGICLESDGRDLDELKEKVKLLYDNRASYFNNLECTNKDVLWKDDCIDPNWYC